MTPEQSRKQDEAILARPNLSKRQSELLAAIVATNGGGFMTPVREDTLKFEPYDRTIRKLMRLGLIQQKPGSHDSVIHTRLGFEIVRGADLIAALTKFDQHQANSRKWLADRGVIV